MVRVVAILSALGLLVSPVQAQKKAGGGNAPAARIENPRRQAPPPPAPKAAAQPAPENRPGQQQVDRLLRMTPAEREKALAALPPTRRQNIERRLGEIEDMPPAQQNRVRNRLELLNSLPPQRQNQVRRSANQFKLLPEERRGLLTQEMQRMSAMPDEERRARMNSEEFRNRYSANEQQMMGNLMEIVPQQ